MNSVISLYLRSDQSAKSVTTVVKDLLNILDRNAAGRLSTSLLEPFLLGDSSILLFAAKSKLPNACDIMSLLKRLLQHSLLTTKSFSPAQLHNLCDHILVAMESNQEEHFWKTAIEVLTVLLTGLTFDESNLPMFKNFVTRFAVECPTTKKFLPTLTSLVYLRLLDCATGHFRREPSLKRLTIVLDLVNLGISIVGPRIVELPAFLTQLSDALHVIASWSKIDKFRDSDGQLKVTVDNAFPFSKFLELFEPLLTQVPCQLLSILQSLVVLFPKICTSDDTFPKVLHLLMQSIRMPSSVQVPASEEDKENPPVVVCPAIAVMKVFNSLVDSLERVSISAQQRTTQLCRLFDLLRVFPNSVEHSEVRLLSWWHFICRLPHDLLNDGFRRFVSPFLANLLGRYLSISAPMGDPKLHLYKLSEANAYEGNRSALKLAQHVFACLFQGAPDVHLTLLDSAPKLNAPEIFLVSNSYQLLVAVAHWLHLIGSCPNLPDDCVPAEGVDSIWIGCVRFLMQLTGDHPEPPESAMAATLRSPSIASKSSRSPVVMIGQHIVCSTCYLVSALPDRPAGLTAFHPLDPTLVLSIVENVGDMLWSMSTTTGEKSAVFFDLLLKLVEVGSCWTRREQIPPGVSEGDLDSCLHRWCDITLRFIAMDPSLAEEAADFGARSDLLRLLRQILLALSPDVVHLAENRSSLDFASQDSTLSLFLGQTPRILYSPPVLRVLANLIDRLTRFILTNHQISEGDPLLAPDLTTVQALLLAPFWFAGSTIPMGLKTGDHEDHAFLSSADELALAKRLSTLFMVFHQEACLLTTVPSNSWIDHLGQKLAAIISAFPSNPSEHVNFNLLGRLLRTLAQNAERVEETGNLGAVFNPFSVNSTPERPFGQLTGLIQALRLCLLHFPWPYPPSVSGKQRSPTRRLSASQSLTRLLMSPPPLPLPSEQIQTDDSSVSQLSLAERLANASHKVSCGLIDALEAVNIILQHHIRSTDHLVYLVDTLSSPLSHLAACCARAEDLSSDELDEPLLIAQRRQQAKCALEEIFINLWKSLGCSPVTAAASSILLVDQTSSTTTNQKPLPLTPHQCVTLLRAGFTMCRNKFGSRNSKFSLYPQWFVGFWNRVVCTVQQSDSMPSTWDSVRSFLDGSASELQAVFSPGDQVAVSQSPNKFDRRVLEKKDTSATDTPKRSRRGRLSLVKNKLPKQSTTPDNNASPSRGRNVTLSAPPAFPLGRTARRSTFLSTSPSSRSSGILASALGIRSDVDPTTTSWSPTAGSPSALPGRPLVKRRLFDDDDDDGGTTKTQSPVKKRRRNSGGSKSFDLKPPNPADFEDSAQFVFIAPAPDNARKRRSILTSHQREKFREQKREYIPTTYTELDCSQQSTSNSQSESQFSQMSTSSLRAVEVNSSVEHQSADIIESTELDDHVSPSDPVTSTATDLATNGSTSPLEAVAESSLTHQEASVSLEKSEDNQSSCVATVECQHTPPISSSSEHEVMSPSISTIRLPFRPKSPTTSPFTLPNTVNLSSPLFRAGSASSRAQRMLALGLQKAAEQKKTAVLNSPSTKAGLDADHSPIAQTRVDKESPPSILRGIAAKRKSQRVSFAEEPTIFTFGSTPSPNSDASLSTPPRRIERDFPSEEVVSCPVSASPNSSLETPTKPVVVETPSVDMDLSQGSVESALSPSTPPPIADHHRRKSTSPQRRLIEAKPRSSFLIAKNPHVKPLRNAETKQRIPNRRRLFVVESSEDAGFTPGEEEHGAIVVADSESTEIVDTQTLDIDDHGRQCSPVSVVPECLIIESSQGSQEVVCESPDCAPASSGETKADVAVQDVVAATETDNSLNNSPQLQSRVDDAEVEIQRLLAQVEPLLANLSEARRQTVFMDFLRTFKSIIS